MAEIILGPIIGGLSHERVNLWARADKPSTLHAWLGRKPNGVDAKPAGRIQLKANTGFAGVVTIDKLSPAKKYFFALTLDPKRKPRKSEFQSFNTFPAPGRAMSFRFAFGSCYLPIREPSGSAFKHILENQDDLAFVLMLGDQIYADQFKSNGIGRIASNLEDFRRVYQKTWSNPHHRQLLARTPAFMILDDHEIDNDWHWNDRALQIPDIAWLTRLYRKLLGRPKDEQYLFPARARAGLQANWEHQAMHAPAKLSSRGPLAYQFEYGAAAFFVMDTRTHRFINENDRGLLGEGQWKMLTGWLRRVKDSHPLKFIASSISFLSDLLFDITDDRWTGFKAERDRLLTLIATEGITGVHFLVGDLHSAHSISANLHGPDGKIIPIHQYCSSPFEQNPNRFSWLMDWPAKSSMLHDRKRHFSIAANNYGIVEVDFSKKNEPQIRFQLNYEKKGKWYRK